MEEGWEGARVRGGGLLGEFLDDLGGMFVGTGGDGGKVAQRVLVRGKRLSPGHQLDRHLGREESTGDFFPHRGNSSEEADFKRGGEVG